MHNMLHLDNLLNQFYKLCDLIIFQSPILQNCPKALYEERVHFLTFCLCILM